MSGSLYGLHGCMLKTTQGERVRKDAGSVDACILRKHALMEPNGTKDNQRRFFVHCRWPYSVKYVHLKQSRSSRLQFDREF